MFKNFSSQDLLYIAIFSALGLAIKPIVTPLIHLVSAPLMIPGGSLAGGFYMLWLVLAMAVVKKPGTAFTVGLVQAIVMLSLGYFGNHGAVSLLSYTLPGIAIELAAFLSAYKNTLFTHVFLCVSANLIGALVVTILVMRLALLPLLISMTAAGISGIIGGILAYRMYVELIKYRLIQR